MARDPLHAPCYEELTAYGADLCEQAFHEALEHGRRRKSAREDFAAGWKEAARRFGHPEVFHQVTT